MVDYQHSALPALSIYPSLLITHLDHLPLRTWSTTSTQHYQHSHLSPISEYPSPPSVNMIDYQHSALPAPTILTLEVHHLMHHLCLIEKKSQKIFQRVDFACYEFYDSLCGGCHAGWEVFICVTSAGSAECW